MSAADKMGHLDDGLVERYSMGRLEEPELGEVEEHLLMCPGCQKRVEEEDQFTRAARAALSGPVSAARESKGRWGFLTNRWAGLVYAAALATLVLVYVPARLHTPAAESVRLAAERGNDLPAARAESPLKLTLDTTSLAPGRYAAEIVDATGRQAWKEETTIGSGEAVLNVSAGLPAGHYWVRLNRDSQPVREFGFVLR
jgi:hypothetical protein